jgi:tetratricopeptide (TPR) repeat protein
MFGKPIPWHVETLRESPILHLPELMSVTRNSPYFRQDATRDRFDAQAWAVVQFMLYGAKGPLANRIGQFAERLLNGVPSDEAVRLTYGGFEQLNAAYSLYVQQGVFLFARAEVRAGVDSSSYSVRALSPAQGSVAVAKLHVAMDRPQEAQKLLAEARKADPAGPEADVVDALLLEKSSDRDALRAAYAKAAAGGTENFWVYYRLGTLAMPAADQEAARVAAGWLEKATTLNPQYAHAHASLSSLHGQLGDGDRAVASAVQAVKLDAGNASYRFMLARHLARAARTTEALQIARDALSLARYDAERNSILSFLTSL